VKHKRGFHRQISICFALITIGFSQVAFNLVTHNPGNFPTRPLFFLWIVLWFQVIPFVILLILDRFLLRTMSELLSRFWRSLLYALFAVSILRQIQFVYEDKFVQLLYFLPVIPLYLLCGILIFLISYRFRPQIDEYFAILGIPALILTIFFAKGMEVRKVNGKPAVAAIHSTDDPSVYMIVFDELSYEMLLKNGQLDRESYPNFASLASESLWFTNATTNHWATDNALPSLLTGVLHPESGTTTLFDQLPANYTVIISETEIIIEQWLRNRARRSQGETYIGKSHFLCVHPVNTARFIMDLAYLSFLGLEDRNEILFSTPSLHVTLPSERSSFLAGLDSKDRTPQFLFWHTSIPHSPFLFSRNGSRHSSSAIHFSLPDREAEFPYESVVFNYREQIRFADTLLGEILDQLKRSHRYESSIIIVTADHGLRVWGNLYGHMDQTARVPLILHAPGVRPADSDIDAQLIDLVPTLLDILKQHDSKSSLDGVSVFSTVRPVRDKLLYFVGQRFAYNGIAKSWDLRQMQEIAGPASGSKEENRSLANQIALSGAVHQAQRGFSAVQALDDLYSAREEKRDFLTLYLGKHFPNTITDSDLVSIQKRLAILPPEDRSPSTSYKKGINYFFLALAQTKRLADGHPEIATLIDGNWKNALENMQNTRDLQPWMTEEIKKILTEADANRDQQLNATELTSIITSRQK